MATATFTRNFKQCPLKKRPIKYEAEHEDHSDTSFNDQPQNLSLKRRSNDALEDYTPPVKRDFVLNLSKSDNECSLKYRPESPVSVRSEPSVILSPYLEDEFYTNHQRINRHRTGLSTTSNGDTTNVYHSAFALAAGCYPMTSLWHNYHQIPIDLNATYPSPASSVQSITSYYSYNSQQITPPLSPGSEDSALEPEDLSIRNDIPLPALLHNFNEMPSSLFTNKAYDFSTTKTKSSNSSLTTGAESKHYRFKCEQCNKMYSTSMGLSKHKQFHCPAAVCNQDKQQHACKECGKLYTTIGALKMHVRTHTLPCKCSTCGKAFSRPWLLQGHIRTHTGEKPFKCSDCPRSFADRSNLRAHQQTHVDIKKYVCRVCSKSFSRMSLLNKHVHSSCTITIA